MTARGFVTIWLALVLASALVLWGETLAEAEGLDPILAPHLSPPTSTLEHVGMAIALGTGAVVLAAVLSVVLAVVSVAYLRWRYSHLAGLDPDDLEALEELEGPR